jgi:hypothetical protein
VADESVRAALQALMDVSKAGNMVIDNAGVIQDAVAILRSELGVVLLNPEDEAHCESMVREGFEPDKLIVDRLCEINSGKADQDLVLECPHWQEGTITLRKGCTACEAEGRQPVPLYAAKAPRTTRVVERTPGGEALARGYAALAKSTYSFGHEEALPRPWVEVWGIRNAAGAPWYRPANDDELRHMSLDPVRFEPFPSGAGRWSW